MHYKVISTFTNSDYVCKSNQNLKVIKHNYNHININRYLNDCHNSNLFIVNTCHNCLYSVTHHLVNISRPHQRSKQTLNIKCCGPHHWR